jgi:hypothetical protein
MPINWIINQPIVEKMDFPQIFDYNGLLISIEGFYPPTWVKAGYLTTHLDIEGQLFNYRTDLIRFGRTVLSVKVKPYKIRFDPVDYLTEQYTPIIKIAQINLSTMEISYPPYTPPAVGEETFETITPPVPTTATSVFLLAAAKPRSRYRIDNKTNKTMYIKEGAAASIPTLTASDPFTAIVAGGSYAGEDYSGDIVGIMLATPSATGRVIVHESPLIV